MTRVLGRIGLALVALLVAVELALAWAPQWIGRRYRVVPETGPRTSLLVVVGDSVAFGYGLPPGEGWGARLGPALSARGVATAVRVNAFPGADLTDTARQLVPCGPGVLYLAMLGHNDFIFNADLRRGTRTIDPEHPRRVVPPPFDRLRTLRLAAWLLDRADGLGIAFDPDLQVRAHAGVTAFHEGVRRCGGSLVILTYVVPHAAPPGHPEADHIAQATAGQRRVNELLRVWAGEAGVPVVDLEHLVPVGPVWTEAEFIDAIHPSAAMHARITDALADQLVERGLAAP